ncbi:MAG: hypothetical protein DSZ32_06220 [Gammaproteobacteria bacterium]|nr:MAG: hypothetical protein DSZ32_06220 [Gammaproteobacteria bacterium]
MRIIRRIMVAMLALLVLLVVIGLFLPQQSTMRRDILIKAAPEQIYAVLEKPREFNNWSPWAGIDPNAKYEFYGPERGVGAAMRWSSKDPHVGVGGSKIIEVDPNRRIRVELDFGDQGINWSEYRLRPEGHATRVVWEFEMHAGMNPIQRWFGLMIDKLVGPSYEEGLRNLKALVEKRAAEPAGAERAPGG